MGRCTWKKKNKKTRTLHNHRMINKMRPQCDMIHTTCTCFTTCMVHRTRFSWFFQELIWQKSAKNSSTSLRSHMRPHMFVAAKHYPLWSLTRRRSFTETYGRRRTEPSKDCTHLKHDTAQLGCAWWPTTQAVPRQVRPIYIDMVQTIDNCTSI